MTRLWFTGEVEPAAFRRHIAQAARESLDRVPSERFHALGDAIAPLRGVTENRRAGDTGAVAGDARLVVDLRTGHCRDDGFGLGRCFESREVAESVGAYREIADGHDDQYADHEGVHVKKFLIPTQGNAPEKIAVRFVVADAR